MIAIASTWLVQDGVIRELVTRRCVHGSCSHMAKAGYARCLRHLAMNAQANKRMRQTQAGR